MDLYIDIIDLVPGLARNMTLLSAIAQKYEFTTLPVAASAQRDAEGFYECFRAEKYDHDYKLTITITTRDKDVTDVESEQTYCNYLEVSKDGDVIFLDSYYTVA